LERKAYAAMGQEDDAAHQVARATREATLAQRLVHVLRRLLSGWAGMYSHPGKVIAEALLHVLP
jgi:hypothetical protein